MRIIWSSKAASDLTRLLTYTRDQRSIATARRRLTFIESATLRLAQWPDIGRKSSAKNIRVLYAPLPECKIIYRIETHDQLTILRLEPDHTRPLHPRIDF